MTSIKVVCFVFITFLALASNSKVEYTLSKLPIAAAYTQPSYDGDNSIYLFGGISSVSDYTGYQILRFDIETDSIEKMTDMPSNGEYGSVQSVDQDIYYFAAYEPNVGFQDVIKFDPTANTAIKVAKQPGFSSFPLHTSFKRHNSHLVYVMVLEDNVVSRLYECDMLNYTNRYVAEFPGFYIFSSVVVGNYAYIFGLDNEMEVQVVLRTDLTTLETESISSNTDLVFSTQPTQPTDGANAFFIGRQDWNSEGAKDALLQYSIVDDRWRYIDVENFPWKDNSDIRYDVVPIGVYVEKLNRIYYFGGSIYNSTSGSAQFLDEIWYIELSSPA